MSTNLEHRLPPMTMSQYITAGLVLIFLEIVFVLLSNEADIITKDHMAWYNPFALMDFANTQMEINKDSFEVKQIDLKAVIADTSKRDLLHLFVIDQTTPALEQTDKEVSFKALFDSTELLFNQTAWLKLYEESIVKKFMSSTPQNKASFYLFSRCLQDVERFKYIVYDYHGIKESILTARKKGNSQKGSFIMSYEKPDDRPELADNFLSYNFKARKDAWTDFDVLFKEIKNQYTGSIAGNLNLSKHDIILTVISDFIHEVNSPNTSGEEKPLNGVIDAFKDLMKNCNRIAAVNLLIMPSRSKDSDKKPVRDELIKELLITCKAKDKPIQQTHHEVFYKAKQFHDAIGILPIKVPVFDPIPLKVYHPIQSNNFEQCGMCRFSFADDDAGSVTLQLTKTSGGTPSYSVLQMLSKSGGIVGDIPEDPEMYNIEVEKDVNYFGRFPYPAAANGFSDLSLAVSAKGSVRNKIIPLKFEEKMTLMETQILGYVTALSVVFAFYWFFLLFTGKVFYNQPGKDEKNDWLDSYIFKKVGKWIHCHKRLSVFIVIALFWIGSIGLMRYSLPAFEGIEGGFFLANLIAIYVSFTFYFHLRHFYIYTNPEGRFKKTG